MDINIEAINHPNQTKLKTYYTDTLNNKYGMYPFVKTITAKVESKNDDIDVSLLVQVEKGASLFGSSSSKNENKALNEAIKKINTQIEKYKNKHYAS